MKILLVQPGYSKRRLKAFTGLAVLPPLNLQLIASSVPEDDVRILDRQIDSDLEKAVISFEPDIVGVTAFTVQYYRSLEVLKLTKKINQEIFTVVGGIHATVMPSDYDREYVDAVVIGEGEETFKELVSTLRRQGSLEGIKGIAYRSNGGLKFNRPRKPISDLSSIPFPRRALTEKYERNYHFYWIPRISMVSFSRGCPYRCKFCSIWRHQGKCRYRSPRSIADELESIREDFICIVDNSFLHNPSWVREVLDQIDKRGIAKRYYINARADHVVKHSDLVEKMAELGLSICLMGLEAVNQKQLDAYNKRASIAKNIEAIRICRDNDVMVYGCFIIDPDFEEEDFDTVIEFLDKHDIMFPQITVLTPEPGTILHEKMFDRITTSNYELYDFMHAVIPTRLPIKEFYRNLARVYESLLTPRRIMNYLARMHELSFSELFSLFDGYPSLSEIVNRHIGRYNAHVLFPIKLHNVMDQLTDYREYLK